MHLHDIGLLDATAPKKLIEIEAYFLRKVNLYLAQKV